MEESRCKGKGGNVLNFSTQSCAYLPGRSIEKVTFHSFPEVWYFGRNQLYAVITVDFRVTKMVCRGYGFLLQSLKWVLVSQTFVLGLVMMKDCVGSQLVRVRDTHVLFFPETWSNPYLGECFFMLVLDPGKSVIFLSTFKRFNVVLDWWRYPEVKCYIVLAVAVFRSVVCLLCSTCVMVCRKLDLESVGFDSKVWAAIPTKTLRRLSFPVNDVGSDGLKKRSVCLGEESTDRRALKSISFVFCIGWRVVPCGWSSFIVSEVFSVLLHNVNPQAADDPKKDHLQSE
ncbi:hypothetical protein V6N13_147078 [Hibiscus sabdariffa]|uniref:Uncharacterized protein n=1 Tax=Hibiscus sabdariffa TaxID=183260 RepID=A0ABR2TUI8_9ROSI